MATFTKVAYRYCDAAGSKYHGEFSVAGVLKREQLLPYLFDGEFFVPEQVGLIHLLTDPWTKNDHVLHTLESFESSDWENSVCSASSMVERFKAASNDWFEGFT